MYIAVLYMRKFAQLTHAVPSRIPWNLKMVDLKKDSEIRKNLYEFLWLNQETSSFSQLFGVPGHVLNFKFVCVQRKFSKDHRRIFSRSLWEIFRGEFGRKSLPFFLGKNVQRSPTKIQRKKNAQKKTMACFAFCSNRNGNINSGTTCFSTTQQILGAALFIFPSGLTRRKLENFPGRSSNLLRFLA